MPSTGIRIRGNASDSTPLRCANTSSTSPGWSTWPLNKPARIPDPPVGSASTTRTGRGQPIANPTTVEVTPGDPDADANTNTAISQPPYRTLESSTNATLPVAARAASSAARDDGNTTFTTTWVSPWATDTTTASIAVTAPSTSPPGPGVCTSRTRSPARNGSAGNMPGANATPTTDSPAAGTTTSVT